MRCLLVLGFGALFAQQGGLSPRDMYYHPVRPEQGRPPGGKAKTNPKGTGGGRTSTEQSGKGGADLVPVAAYFGVRYNVLRYVDKENAISEPVDPDGNFRSKDCLAIELKPNRGGHLYVFNRASSGRWQVMLPNKEMEGELDMVPGGATVRIPQKHCFGFDENRGVETLRLVLTDEEDFKQLNDSMQKDSSSKGGTLVAAQRMAEEFAKGNEIASRDLVIEKIGRPQEQGEPPNSVYIVRPLDKGNRMVVDLKIRHE